MRQGIVKTIDGKDYEIWHLPALDAMKVLVKILKIILEPIGKGLGKSEKELQTEVATETKSFLDKDIDFSGLFCSLANRLDEKEIQEIMKIIFEYVYKKNDNGGFEKVNLAIDFKGEFFHMLNVFKEALGVNYSDFFSVIGDPAKVPFLRKAVQTLEKQM